jgi:toxin ParE1/3/4
VGKRRSSFKVVLSPAARDDIRDILRWSEKKFGKNAALRYEALLAQSLKDVGRDPERPGVQHRPELASGVLVYPLRFSSDLVESTLGPVQHPRHFIIYRKRTHEKMIDIARVLHDARDLQQHVPEEYRSNSTPRR